MSLKIENNTLRNGLKKEEPQNLAGKEEPEKVRCERKPEHPNLVAYIIIGINTPP